MPDPRSRLQIVEEIPDQQPQAVPADPLVSVGATALMLGIKALSQRTLVALDGLSTLITVGLVFWLWLSIPNPSVNQLVGMGMFAIFVLAANFVARKRA